MGLLNRIQELNGQKGGLLARAEEFENSKQTSKEIKKVPLTFVSFAQKNFFNVCGILSAKNDFYYLRKSSGLDLKSIENSVSTKDFWNGIIDDNNKWNIFEGESLNPFFQLFSDKIKENLKKIAILPFENESQQNYFFVINPQNLSLRADSDFILLLKETLEQNSTEQSLADFDFNKGFAISAANLFIISAKLALTSAFSSFNDQIKNELTSAAMEVIFESLKKLFAFPNTCVLGSDEEIKCVLFAKEEIDEKLLQFQLNNSIKDFFDNNSFSNLLVLSAGICQNQKGTAIFLSGK